MMKENDNYIKVMEDCCRMSKDGIKLAWNGEVTGEGTITGGKLSTNIAIPESLGGSGNGTDPKELLVSSAATCYLTTLVSILQNRKVPVEEQTMQSDVEIGEDKSITIIHYPQVTLASNASSDDKENAEKAMHGADNACFIGKLLKNAGVTIEMKPEVISKQA